MKSTFTVENDGLNTGQTGTGPDSPADPGRSPSEGPDPGAPDAELSKQACIDELLAKATKLYSRFRRKERELLKERIEIGEILIRLKKEVGHGNFLDKLRQWIALKQLNFCYATANRAMAYAKLEAAGKLSSVRNLAEAEGVRKAEAKQKKQEEQDGDGAKKGDDGDDQDPVTLKKSQIGPKAKVFVRSLIENCRSYDTESKVGLLEEVIELLTMELEQCC